MKLVLVIVTTVIYAIIDIAWNINSTIMDMYRSAFERSGLNTTVIFRSSIADAGVPALIGAVVFFTLIGLANVRFAIMPAFRKRRLSVALSNSFLFGCAAYATYIFPVYLQLDNYPASLLPIDIVIGGLLSLSTSAIVMLLFRRTADRIG